MHKNVPRARRTRRRPRDGRRDLAKRHPNGTDAVRGISFRVRTGEVFGILGPNGAGKSTTMGMLGTLVRPTGGRATVAGLDVVEHPGGVRRRIGFAMQEVGVDELATGRELLVLNGRLHGLARREAARRADLLLDLVGLSEAADRRMGEYSGGMQRRADLASALIHLPPVLFLDESTEGLAPPRPHYTLSTCGGTGCRGGTYATPQA